MKNQKAFLIGVVVLFFIAILAVAGYFAYKKFNVSKEQVQTQQNLIENNKQVVTQINNTAAWKTYTSDNKYFSVLWPSNWTIQTDKDYGIILFGKEGSFNIAWNGLGGACEPSEIKEIKAGEDFYWICDQKSDGSYYSATITKISDPNMAIGIIPTYVGATESDKLVFLQVLKSIKMHSIAQILSKNDIDTQCNENNKYYVISKDISGSGENRLLIKYKKDYTQQVACAYNIGKTDFEIKGEFQNFLALTDNFIILDAGTGPEPRGLIVYNLNTRKRVYDDSYGKPVLTQGDTVTYWSPIAEKATKANCSKFDEWTAQGLPPIIEAHVTLNLLDLTKKDLRENRCVPTQG